MAVRSVSLLTLLPLCLASDASISATSSLSFDAESAKNRPISKVVTLLKDMLKQLEKDSEIDEEVYEKFICWCTVNDKDKTKAIKDAEQKIKLLNLKIDEWSSSSSQLSIEISGHDKDIVNLRDNLEKATAIRMKELAEFNAHEQELLDIIAALKAAIATLQVHHPHTAAGATMLLQRVSGSSRSATETSAQSAVAALERVLQKHSDALRGVVTHKQQRILSAFLQQPADYMDAEPTFKQSYAPQSGEILGILKQMLEEFEHDLSVAQKDEIASQTQFEELKASIMKELEPTINVRAKKDGEKADKDQKTDDAKKDLEDTMAALAANKEYLLKVREKCRLIDLQYEARLKTRQLEVEAVTKAIAILSTDESMDLATDTFNSAAASLLQKELAENKQKQSKASDFLVAVAQKIRSPKLAAFALRVRLDAFTKVKEAIDDMIAQLLKQQEDEIKHKDFCVDDFNTNQLQTEKKEREKTDLEALIDDLKMTIAKLTKEIAALEADIAETQMQLKRAGEDREAENKEFQQTVADQRATQKLLSAAMAVLKGFYDKEHEVYDLHKGLLLQKKPKTEPAGPPPPPDFADYQKQPSGGVLGLIAQIIKDAKAMEAEAIKDEGEAVAAYEDFVSVSNESIDSDKKAIAEKKEQKAKAEVALATAEKDLDFVISELDGLAAYKAELHSACDYVLKNFDIRQTKRGEEIEALKQAKAILSGAKFEAFLQKRS